MSKSSSLGLYVSVDVGCHRHQIGMGLSTGKFWRPLRLLTSRLDSASSSPGLRPRRPAMAVRVSVALGHYA
jgi:hypothetical protein